jgi:hypothetical protein
VPVDPAAPLVDFEAVAEDYPVFRVDLLSTRAS